MTEGGKSQLQPVLRGTSGRRGALDRCGAGVHCQNHPVRCVYLLHGSTPVVTRLDSCISRQIMYLIQKTVVPRLCVPLEITLALPGAPSGSEVLHLGFAHRS